MNIVPTRTGGMFMDDHINRISDVYVPSQMDRKILNFRPSYFEGANGGTQLSVNY